MIPKWEEYPCVCGEGIRRVRLVWEGGSGDQRKGLTIEAGKSDVEEVLSVGYITISDKF